MVRLPEWGRAAKIKRMRPQFVEWESWDLNLQSCGGFHHCSGDKGGGFCAYADITLSIKFLFERLEGISKATIIDLDAHQGNGHARDFMDDKRVYIMDMYNRHIYPGDTLAKQAIKRRIELDWGTEDKEYLEKVETHVKGALNEVTPDVIIYNAGTDILDGDPLGGLSISPQGIIKRDEIVFSIARSRSIPILMVTSGGYQKRTARIIADSIINLHNLGLISNSQPTFRWWRSGVRMSKFQIPCAHVKKQRAICAIIPFIEDDIVIKRWTSAATTCSLDFIQIIIDKNTMSLKSIESEIEECEK
ncbi:unnamed protein product [Ranitomeya imitator]|uniref:Histone deacetylase domain-containing protein n=1 Tax=Ranitomeya imitator TaxID=111125 RepID=A0ABN9L275_9NEOB|nr:unnamed protein product [Ranitomeya imitator]